MTSGFRHFGLGVGAARRAIPAAFLALALNWGAAPALAAGILTQGGGITVAPVASSIATSIVNAQQAAALTAQSQNDLSRVATALAAMQTMQNAAHNLALTAPSAVPQGLAAGGLVPDTGLAATGVANPVTRWANAETPVQATNAGRTTVSVTQTGANAILNWSSFNIGKSTTLNIDQSGGNISTGNNWVALNRVENPAAVPSQILGSIQAQGTVLVIDANGIIFGGGAQVDVHSLIASSLYLFNPDDLTSNNIFLAGLDSELGTTAYDQTEQLLGTANNLPIVAAGNITIDSGAAINISGAQGYAVIAAPNVSNAGAISAPDGQVVLAAGDGLQIASPFTPGSSGQPAAPIQNPVITGLAYPAPATGNAYPFTSVVNTGEVLALRGNITVLAGDVTQNGIFETTTSVNHPGTIIINATYPGAGSFLLSGPAVGGSVTFGPGAVTAILPDADGQTVPTGATNTFAQGAVTVTAGGIEFQGGSLTEAPGQAINISTAAAISDAGATATALGASGNTVLDPGAVIDVAGIADIELPMSANLITVPRLGQNELADDPLERNGFLYDQADLVFDTRVTGVNALTGLPWVGSPLADLQGYVSQIPETVDQLLLNGGSINVAQGLRGAGGFTLVPTSFIAEQGSVIDIAGGYVHYLGGEIDTTELLGADGHVYNVGNANPNIPIVGFAGTDTVTSTRWGQSESFSSLLSASGTYESDYVQGGNGGSLNIGGTSTAASANVDATPIDSFLGGTIDAAAPTGLLQAANGAAPKGSTLKLANYNNLLIEAGQPALPAGFSATKPFTQILTVAATQAPAAELAALDQNLQIDTTVLSAGALSAAGFGALDFGKFAAAAAAPIANNMDAVGESTEYAASFGSFTLQTGATLQVRAGGQILIGAPSDITIDGSLVAPSGTIAVEDFGSLGNYTLNIGALDNITIGPRAVLDVQGEWVNDSLAARENLPASGGQFINAGTITLATDKDVYQLLDSAGDAVDGIPLYSLESGVPLQAPYTPNASDPVYLDQTGSIDVAAGAVLNLQSGGRVLPSGALQTTSGGSPAGAGGSLNLITYAGSNWISPYDSPPPETPGPVRGTVLPFEAPTNAHIDIAGTVETGSFAGGGTLTVQAPSIKIGGGPTGAAGEYYVPAAFFTNNVFNQANVTQGAGGGFGAYDFIGVLGGVDVAPGTDITLRQQNLQPSAAVLTLPTGGNLDAVAALGLSPAIYRAPVNLTLNADEDYIFYPESLETEYYTPGHAAPDYTGPTGTYVTVSDALLGLAAPLQYTSGEDPTLYFGASSPATGIALYGNPTPVTGSPASITGDPRSTVSLLGNSDIIVNGDVSAPGGTINVEAADPAADGQFAAENIYLLPGSILSASGTLVADTRNDPGGIAPPAAAVTVTEGGDTFAAHTGTVLAGGTINFTGGALLTDAGSLIDVSGAAATIDQSVDAPAGLATDAFAPLGVYSNAGTIDIAVSSSFTGTGTLLLDGALKGTAGAAAGFGGNLILNNSFSAGGRGQLIVVQQTDAGLPVAGALPIDLGDPLSAQAATADYAGGAYLPVSALAGSGIDSLTLQGFIAFSGPVDLSLGRQLILQGADPGSISGDEEGPQIVQLPAGADAANDTDTLTAGIRKPVPNSSLAPTVAQRTVSLSAPYIWIDSTGANQDAEASADGVLNLDAAAIDVTGQTSFANIGDLNLNATGTVRFDDLTAPVNLLQPLTDVPTAGFLMTSGNLTVSAGVIYPESGDQFALVAYGQNGTITFNRSGSAQAPPLAAGATLVVAATNIVQNGDIQVPFGTLQLGSLNPVQDFSFIQSNIYFAGIFANAGDIPATASLTVTPGSVTSVSGAGLTIPYGETVDGIDAYYYDHSGLPLTAPPQKLLNLASGTIDIEAGADVDLSGGGTLYETEFVAGTGGSRDVLSRYEYNATTASSIGGLTNPTTGVPLYYQYPNGQDVYAIVPGVQPEIAYNDPDFQTYYLDGQTVTGGEAVYLSGVPGLASGTYTLLPGHYATLPGAYRVVVDPGAAALPEGTSAVTLADGTILADGYAADSVTGQRAASPTVYSIESQAVWSQYSEIDIHNASTFFTGVAALAETPVPRLPQDAGHLILQVLKGLAVNSTFDTSPVDGGRVAEADVTGSNLEIIAPGGAVETGFVGLNAGSLDALNAGSLLIGGTRALNDINTTIDNVNYDTSVITPTANNIIVANNAANPLTGPEILFAVVPVQAKAQNVDAPNNVTGPSQPVFEASYGPSSIVVAPGAVIEATGALTGTQPQILQLGENLTGAGGTTESISNYLTLDTQFGGYDINTAGLTSLYQTIGLSAGAVLRVSDGAPVQIDRLNLSVPAQYGTIANDTDYASVRGSTTLGYQQVYLPSAPASALQIDGGATLSSDGSLVLASTSYGGIAPGAVLASPNVAITSDEINIGDVPAGSLGFSIDAALLAQLSQISTVSLATYDKINIFGDVTFGAVGGPLQSLTLDGPIFGDGGTVTLDAGTVELATSLATGSYTPANAAAGSFTVNAGTVELGQGAKIISGYDAVTLNAGTEVSGTGTGSLNAGDAAFSVASPLLLAESGSSQTITTAGDFTLTDPSGAAPVLASDQSGGTWAVNAASVTSGGTIEALSGNIELTALTGNVTLTGGALRAGGYSELFFDTRRNAPAGAISLSAANGDVITSSTTTLDVSASAYGGNAGAITVQAPTGAAEIGGTLLGEAGAGATEASFTLSTGQGLDLDQLALLLQAGGFTDNVSIHTLQGDLDLSHPLTAANVLLVADGGVVNIASTIDASGAAGGTIGLYGLEGVTLQATAQLLASASDSSQLGGSITLGTEAVATNGVNASDGSEAVTQSGIISIAAGAKLDVAGGVAADGSSLGGTVTLLAPILADDKVDVTSAGTVIGARAAVLDAYKTWATSDPSTGSQHFDGIIDPAGYFDANGERVDGTWYYDTPTPNTIDNYHRDPGIGDGNDGPFATEEIGTEVDGVRYDVNGNVVADSAPGFFVPTTPNENHVAFYQGTLMNFVQNPGVTGPAGFTLQPGIDLVANDPYLNDGDITVASNWNLGAGEVNPSGGLTLFYRVGGTAAGAPGVLSLRAINSVNIDADITDGFFQTGNTLNPDYTVASDLYEQQAINKLSVDGAGSAAGNLLGTIAAPAIPYDTADPLYDGISNSYETAYITYGKAWIQYSTAADIALIRANPTTQGVVNYTVELAPAGAIQPGNYGSYNAYIGAYDGYVSAYTPQPSGSTVTALAAPTAPVLTSFASYAAYNAAYTVYNTAYGNYLAAYTGAYLPAARTDLLASLTQASMPYAPGTEAAPNPAFAPTAFNLTTVEADPYFYGANGPGDNPTVNDPNPVPTANLFPYGVNGPGTFVSSWSYQITSGADLSSANPAQVQPLADFGPNNGNVTLNGHTEYPWIYSGSNSEQSFGPSPAFVLDDPTILRTGTGSIDIAAAQNVETLDTVAPAVIYTAGHASPPPVSADFTAGLTANPADGSGVTSYYIGITPQNPDGFEQATGQYVNYNDILSYDGSQLSSFNNNPDSLSTLWGSPILFSQPAYPEDGGNLTITAQQDIIGIQNVIDQSGLRESSLRGYIGEAWNSWLFSTGTPASNDQYGWYAYDTPGDQAGASGYTQQAWWINFASFDQGVGALGGGNVTIAAGRNVQDLSVSLPETGQVWGGLTYANADGTRNLPEVHTYGAGNLSLVAGGDLISSALYVGNGTGNVSVGGGVYADPSVTGGIDTVSGGIPLEIALQNATLNLVATGTVNIGDVVSPTQLYVPDQPGPGYILDPALDEESQTFNVGAPESGNLFSTFSPTSGVTITSTGGAVNYKISPATVSNANLMPNPLFLRGEQFTFAPSSVTATTADSPANIQLTSFSQDITIANNFTMTPSQTGLLAMYAGGNINQDASFSTGPSDISIAFDPTQVLLGFNSPDEGLQLMHADDPAPDQLYALLNIQNLSDTVNNLNAVSLNDIDFSKETEVHAGEDLINLNFFGENVADTNVTSVIAGHDIKRVLVLGPSGVLAVGNSYSISGPGFFYVAAGRDLGPFVPSGQATASATQNGIIATGDYIAPGSSTINPLLPAKSANIFAFAGVSPGIDYQNVIATYLNPATASVFDSGASLASVLTELGLAGSALPTAQAYAQFESYAAILQDIIVDRYFDDVLKASGEANANVADASRNYLAGYEIINALYPASYGYTQNNLTTTGNSGAITTAATGNFDLRNSLIETQQTGNISLFAPGGEILVGSAGANSAQSNPADSGIITIQPGSIYTFSDQSVEVNQSRIFAEQGGDIVMWSSNGNIDAGRGAKTSASVPPPSYICDVNNVCYVDSRGAVSGAGIATLQSVPGAPTGDAVLVAPVGTVNAGDAGIRVSGNLFISALHVENADNIQVQGSSSGVPVSPSVDVSGLTSAAGAAGAAAQAAEGGTGRSNQSALPSIWIVEVLGYGGGGGGNTPPHKPRKPAGNAVQADNQTDTRMF